MVRGIGFFMVMGTLRLRKTSSASFLLDHFVCGGIRLASHFRPFLLALATFPLLVGLPPPIGLPLPFGKRVSVFRHSQLNLIGCYCKGAATFAIVPWE